jgi:hypothetical protein
MTNKIEFDFSKITNEKELNAYLAEKLNLPAYVNGNMATTCRHFGIPIRITTAMIVSN